MNLYVFRHAHAADINGETILTDEERPLTEKGWHQVDVIAKALQLLQIPLQIVLTSPLKRAKETAEGLCSRLSNLNLEPIVTPKLTPGTASKKVSKMLLGYEEEHVMIVGHEPDLSTHTAWLIGSRKAMIKLPKAGLVCVNCVAPGKGLCELEWLLTPKCLETLMSSNQ